MISRFLETSDLIGQHLYLKYDGNERMRHPFGGVLCLILGVFLIFGAFQFGRPIVMRTNPKVTLSNSFSEKGVGLNLTGNFPLMASMGRRGSKPIPDFETYYNVTLVYYYRDVANDIAGNFTERKNGFGICNEEDLNGKKQDFLVTASRPDLKSWFCLKQDQEMLLHGKPGDPKFLSFTILFNYCKNGTEIICKPRSVMEAEMQNVFVQILLPNYYMDSNNSTEPGQFYVHGLSFPTSSSTYKKNYVYYKSIEYTSDKGFLFEDNIQKSYNVYDFTSEQLYLSLSSAYSPDTITETLIVISPIKDLYFRNYYKIQNLLADMGGLIKALITVFQIAYFLVMTNFNYIRLFDSIFPLYKKELPFNQTQVIKYNDKSANTLTRINQFKATKAKLGELKIKPDISLSYPNVNKSNLKHQNPNNITFYQILCSCGRTEKNQSIINKKIKFVNNLLDIRTVLSRLNSTSILTKLNFEKEETKLFDYVSKACPEMHYYNLDPNLEEKLIQQTTSNNLNICEKKLLNIMKDININS